MSQTVLSAREGRVAILTINRPDKLNALNEEVRVELLAALAEIETDDAVGVVVITGAGEKSFIAGADIGEFAGRIAVRPAPRDAQPAHLRRHGLLPEAGDRDDQRLLPRRRLRALDVVRHARSPPTRPASASRRSTSASSPAAAAPSACRASSASATRCA